MDIASETRRPCSKDDFQGNISVFILMADIIDSTTTIQNLVPSEVYASVKSIFLQVVDKLRDFPRVKFVERCGDQMLLISKCPQSIVDVAKYIQETAFPCLRTVVRFRTAIHHGDIFGGIVELNGGGPRFAVFGNNVNFCARLMSCSRSNSIIVSQACKNQLEAVSGVFFEEQSNTPIRNYGGNSVFFLTFCLREQPVMLYLHPGRFGKYTVIEKT